jgi:hypothetical protein
VAMSLAESILFSSVIAFGMICSIDRWGQKGHRIA